MSNINAKNKLRNYSNYASPNRKKNSYEIFFKNSDGQQFNLY